MTLSRGIYHIRNTGAPVSMDLHNRSSADGTQITGWKSSEGTINEHQLCLIAGTYINLAGGNSSNKTYITGMSRAGTNQEWIIKHSGQSKLHDEELCIGKYVQYLLSLFPELILLAFADLYDGGSSNGTPIYGWKSSVGFNSTQSHQCWFFQRMSLSSADVRMVIGRNPHLTNNYKSYLVDGEYLILPNAKLWQEIWEIMQAAVAQWKTGKWLIDNFAIFCGLMLGRSLKDPIQAHAYNFNVGDDHSRVVFFEPQNNKFMISSHLSDFDSLRNFAFYRIALAAMPTLPTSETGR
ncbi:hypothetical protein EDD18DRAFT_1403398 [Armillaria luteobubalina]|uniref:Agglutinin C-terminal domain-containing protein n=1 Tax=Armillaria luteobubalina TaxID=153913 RepID=A0AA39Q1N0_9AGAR|nr:hypothetical protein EDD18DRAFT_1403398 [Armillaria luteobubalina]